MSNALIDTVKNDIIDESMAVRLSCLDTMLDLNVRACFVAAQAAVKKMLEVAVFVRTLVAASSTNVFNPRPSVLRVTGSSSASSVIELNVDSPLK